MTRELAPLPELSMLAEECGVILAIDDAHGLGYAMLKNTDVIGEVHDE
jgi:7-keto-8-aminopelargonate synthetase-like enzyme